MLRLGWGFDNRKAQGYQALGCLEVRLGFDNGKAEGYQVLACIVSNTPNLTSLVQILGFTAAALPALRKAGYS